jgi:hypothetical protein
MPVIYEIRADYDERTIVVYQAYGRQIAGPAVEHGRFVPPFSLSRMTWIKPSFLWLMERSNWAQKSGQEHILALRITRAGWDEALSQAVLTHPEPSVYPDPDEWRKQLEQAHVHVQWDPERSLRGASLEHRAIQIGLSRHIIQRYVDEWVQEIRDLTPLVRKLHTLIRSGAAQQAKKLLPPERVYPVTPATARRLGMAPEQHKTPLRRRR